MGKRLLKILLLISSCIICLAVILLKPIDRSPFTSQLHWKEWKTELENTNFDIDSIGMFSAGWSKVNITPDAPTPLAGYGSRIGKQFSSVADSIYVRTIVIDNEHTKLALVSADLLIIPPQVSKLVTLKLKDIGFTKDQVYFSATHSHNSIGGWYNSLVGYVFAGKYNHQTELRLADAIIKSIVDADAGMHATAITFEIDLDSLDIQNRIENNGIEDPYIRSLHFHSDSISAALLSYGAHPTVLSQKNLSLSRDYPGVVLNNLKTYDFSMFMAGAVGSMGTRKGKYADTVSVKEIGNSVAVHFNSLGLQTNIGNSGLIWSKKIKLPLPKPAPRVSSYFALRPWAFNWLFGRSETYIQVARIGNVLMVGLPCDFSGELVEPLEKLASSQGLKLMITSFNGGYVGYITADKHYDEHTYETYIMNWYGPNNGAYFSAVIKDILDRIK